MNYVLCIMYQYYCSMNVNLHHIQVMHVKLISYGHWKTLNRFRLMRKQHFQPLSDVSEVRCKTWYTTSMFWRCEVSRVGSGANAESCPCWIHTGLYILVATSTSSTERYTNAYPSWCLRNPWCAHYIIRVNFVCRLLYTWWWRDPGLVSIPESGCSRVWCIYWKMGALSRVCSQ